MMCIRVCVLFISPAKWLIYFTAAKTDLSLLIECLKFQMKCPESQKQALLAIYSICQSRGQIEIDLNTEAFSPQL